MHQPAPHLFFLLPHCLTIVSQLDGFSREIVRSLALSRRPLLSQTKSRVDSGMG
jgi:hypothetical protein